MPSLDWIGKKAVVNHHKQVPFHLLRQNMESVSYTHLTLPTILRV